MEDLYDNKLMAIDLIRATYTHRLLADGVVVVANVAEEFLQIRNAHDDGTLQRRLYITKAINDTITHRRWCLHLATFRLRWKVVTVGATIKQTCSIKFSFSYQ